MIVVVILICLYYCPYDLYWFLLLLSGPNGVACDVRFPSIRFPLIIAGCIILTSNYRMIFPADIILNKPFSRILIIHVIVSLWWDWRLDSVVVISVTWLRKCHVQSISWLTISISRVETSGLMVLTSVSTIMLMTV